MLPNCDNSAAHSQVKKTLSSRDASTQSEALLSPAAIDLNIEVPDLLAQRVAVQAQQVGGADLVAAGRGQRGREKRHLDLLEDAVIEAGRRHAVGEAGKVRGQVRLDRA